MSIVDYKNKLELFSALDSKLSKVSLVYGDYNNVDKFNIALQSLLNDVKGVIGNNKLEEKLLRSLQFILAYAFPIKGSSIDQVSVIGVREFNSRGDYKLGVVYTDKNDKCYNTFEYWGGLPDSIEINYMPGVSRIYTRPKIFKDKKCKIVIRGENIILMDHAFDGLNIQEIDGLDNVVNLGRKCFANVDFKNPSIKFNNIHLLGMQSFDKSNVEELNFEDCKSLNYVSSRSFYGCSKLRNLVLPDSVMLLGNEILNMSSKIDTFIIPSNINKICRDTFKGMRCKKLILPETIAEISGIEDIFISSVIDEIEIRCSNIFDKVNQADLATMITFSLPHTKFSLNTSNCRLAECLSRLNREYQLV